MIDRLLAWWNRPLEDAERRRLFAFAALGLVAVAVVLVAQQRAAPEAPRPTASAPLEAQPPARVAQPGGAVSEQQEGEGSEPSERSVPSKAEVGEVKRAAKRFLAGYLPYTQARKKATAIRSADPDLRSELARQPARVPLTQQGKTKRGRVLTVQAEEVGSDRASTLALVAEGKRRYTVELQLVREDDQWRVTDVS